MISGFQAKADGISIYSRKLCDSLRDMGIIVERVNVSKEQRPLIPGGAGLVHLQFGMQFFSGKYGVGVVPYLLRLRLLGSKVIVTFHDVPIEVQPRRSLSFFRNRTAGMGIFAFYARLGKIAIATVKAYTVLFAVIALANVIVVHTKACQRVFFHRAVLIPHGSDLVAKRVGKSESGTPLILTFGIIHRARKVDFVMRELAALPVYYVVAGACFDPEFLGFLVKHKPSNADVVLSHPPLDRLIQSSWAVVIPPSPGKPEHASGVLHVAASFGRPVMSPPIGEPAEFPEYFMTYTNGTSLRTRIMEIVKDEQLRMDYSRRGLAFAEKTSFPRVAKMHARLYSMLAS